MKKITLLSILLVAFLGCGEEKEKADTITEISFIGSGYTYAFVKKRLIDREIFRVYKADTKWKIVSYEFNATHFKANQIKGGDAQQTGKYSITDDGHLKLTIMETITYVKPTKEDSDKIYLLWTNNKSDLNKTEPSKDTYFFKEKEKADEFVK